MLVAILCSSGWDGVGLCGLIETSLPGCQRRGWFVRVVSGPNGPSMWAFGGHLKCCLGAGTGDGDILIVEVE